MTGNRVEELEKRVAELEATVSGLTDELVETKERLRLVEDHFGPELDAIIEGAANRPQTSVASPGESGSGETPQAAVDATVEASSSETADGSKPDEAETDDETAGSDDIIVA